MALLSLTVAEATENPELLAERSLIVPVTPGKSGEVRETSLTSNLTAGVPLESSNVKLTGPVVAVRTLPRLRSMALAWRLKDSLAIS